MCLPARGCIETSSRISRRVHRFMVQAVWPFGGLSSPSRSSLGNISRGGRRPPAPLELGVPWTFPRPRRLMTGAIGLGMWGTTRRTARTWGKGRRRDHPRHPSPYLIIHDDPRVQSGQALAPSSPLIIDCPIVPRRHLPPSTNARTLVPLRSERRSDSATVNHPSSTQDWPCLLREGISQRSSQDAFQVVLEGPLPANLGQEEDKGRRVDAEGVALPNLPCHHPLLPLGLLLRPARHPEQAFPEYPQHQQGSILGPPGRLLWVRSDCPPSPHSWRPVYCSRHQSPLTVREPISAYPLASLGHAAWILRHYSYRAVFIWGLFLYGLGALLAIPAILHRSFAGFCICIFIIGNGLGSLETAANPYITGRLYAALGIPPPVNRQHGARR